MIKRTIKQAAAMAHAKPYMEHLGGKINPVYFGQKNIHGISTDSRTIEPGMLYIPLIGARADGHDFIEQVKKKGAAAALWQKNHKPYPKDIPLLMVEDTLASMQQLAASYIRQLEPYTIGVTGSNGKTSTKDMIASIFSKEGKTQKTEGNHNNEIGLPMTILDFDEDIEFAVLEMGMENFGEIHQLCEIAPLDAAVIVSIGSAHLENLGSKKGIAKAKMEIVDGLQGKGILVWNADSPELREILSKPLPGRIKTISFGRNAEFSPASDIFYTNDGIVFEASCFEDPIEVHAIGDYQAANALAAAATALAAGLSEEQIREGLQEVELTKMRSALLYAKKARILDDTYKSNPESASNAIETLMKIPGKKHIAVLADMLDLGETTHELHAWIGTKAKLAGVDMLYAYGPLSKDTAQAFGGKHYEDKKALLRDLLPYLDQDAVLLIKGSRAMKMDEVTSWLLKENNQNDE